MIAFLSNQSNWVLTEETQLPQQFLVPPTAILYGPASYISQKQMKHSSCYYPELDHLTA